MQEGGEGEVWTGAVSFTNEADILTICIQKGMNEWIESYERYEADDQGAGAESDNTEWFGARYLGSQ